MNDNVIVDEQNLQPTIVDCIKKEQTSGDTIKISDVPTSNQTVREEFIRTTETAYIDTVNKIVDISKEHLSKLQDHRIGLRKRFVQLFTSLVVSQTAILLILFLIIGFPVPFNLSENILLCYMGTIMIETLGCVVIMIKFSFNTSEEAHIISVLNSIVGQYQKYEEEKKKDKI